MKIKHSKYKNTGVLFELLVRQITADTLKGVDSPAIDILKKFFVKTTLGKEYKLYETVLKSKTLSEGKANSVISTIIDSSKNYSRGSLKKQKYNLINEIRKHYELDVFFGSKIESYSNKSLVNTTQIINNKITLLEHLTKNKVSKKDIKKDVLEEFSSYDKDTRILTYKVLLEKFNSKYDKLSNEQKNVLKEFINSVDSTPGLRNFYNSKINELKSILIEESKSIKDKVTEIKIKEISKYLVEIDKTQKVTNDDLVDLLQYYELLKEIKVANAVQV